MKNLTQINQGGTYVVSNLGA